MLASWFVSQGVKAISDPSAEADQADLISSRVAPLVKNVVPESVSGLVPQDPASWARITGVVRVLAGLGLASGIGRRWSAAVLAATTVPGIVSSARGIRSGDLQGFLGHVALTGGALLAAQDTEGRPGVAYRVKESSRRLRQQNAVKEGKRAARRARRQVKTAATKARGALAR